jgi:hypothetical protein
LNKRANRQALSKRAARGAPRFERARLVGAALALLMGLSAWFLLRSRAPHASVQPPAEALSEPSAPAGPRAPLEEPAVELEPALADSAAPSELLPPPMSAEEAREKSLEHAQRSLQLYRDTMVFPPWSRPYDGSTQHLVDWNRAWGVGQPFAADKSRREIRADVTLDKLYAGPGEAMAVTLTVSYVDTGDPTDPDALSGRVECYDIKSETWKLAADVAFSKSAAGHYRASFTPSSIAALSAAPQEARFIAHLKIADFFKDLPQPFQYAAKEVFAVRQLVAERVTEGSLEIVLDVDVSYVAPTLVQAALFDASGKTAIAVYDDYYRPAAVGRAQLSLRFFGKILRDKGLNGPYSLRALHGHVKVPTAEPPEVFWSRADSPPIITHAYSASQFSDSAWSAPEKAEKIDQYAQVISEFERK